MKTALTIAGSDSSGGAGIQADLKAMTMNGVFAMSAITALTAQNTTGVSGIFEVSPEFLAQQIDAVFTDIRPCAVKIGMVLSLIHIFMQRGVFVFMLQNEPPDEPPKPSESTDEPPEELDSFWGGS